MMKKIIFILLLSQILPQSGFAVDFKFRRNKKTNEYSLKVSLDKNEIKLSKVTASGNRYDRLFIKQATSLSKVGLPEQVYFNKLLYVPAGSYTIRYVYSEPEVFSNIKLYPQQKLEMEKKTFPFMLAEQYKNFKTILKTDETIKSLRVNESTGLMLKLSPVEYDAKKQSLTIYKKVTAIVNPIQKVADKLEFSSNEDDTISHLMLTSENENEPTPARKVKPSRNEAVILSKSSLLSATAPYEALHKEYNFTKVSTDGMDVAKIRLKLKELYKTKAFDSVVIIGDETIVPVSQLLNLPSDSHYALLAGDDNFLDVVVGRIPVKNADEFGKYVLKLQNFLNHQISYLKTKSGKNDILLIAHHEQYPEKYSRNIAEIKANPLHKSFNFDDEYGGKDATNSKVIDLMSNHYFPIIDYRGHGDYQEWWAWDKNEESLDFNQLDSMNKSMKSLSIFLNIACNTGGFHRPEQSMAEKMLSDSTDHGAIMVLAATEPSMTSINHNFNKYIFEQMSKSQKVSTMGRTILEANNELIKDNGGEMVENVAMYVILGDPLIKPTLKK